MTTTTFRAPVGERLRAYRLIAVFRAPSVSALTPVCDVLVEEGILSLELTLTTPALLDALPKLIDRYGAVADVGVGTIVSESDAQRAIDCGANYLVTPTMNLPVVRLAVEHRVPIFPGGLADRALCRLGGGRHRGQDLPGTDRWRDLPQAFARPLSRSPGHPVRRHRPGHHAQMA